VRKHVKDYDAQKVYAALVGHAKYSTSAKLAVEKLVDYRTTTKLDASWHGTSVGFLLTWGEQLRLLEDMTDISEHYPNNVKRRMIEAAVCQVPDPVTSSA